MKNLLLTAALAATLMSAAKAEAQVYQTSEFIMSPTGVSNDGKIVGGSGQDTPFILWDPLGDGTARVIGGMSSGQDGAAGPARITADGKTVIGSIWNNDIDVPITWVKSVYEKRPYPYKYWTKQSDFNMFIAGAIPETNNSYVLKSANNGRSWVDNVDSFHPIEGIVTGIASMNSMRTILVTDAGKLYWTTGNSIFNEAEVQISGDSETVKGYLSLGIVYKNAPNVAYGAIGVEHEDGTYAVWYSTDNFESFLVSTGVAGKPTYMSSTGETLYLSTSNGHIQKSEDKGATWTDICVMEDKNFIRVSFNDENNGIIITDDKVYLTKDGGVNWIIRNLDLPTEADVDGKMWNDALWREDYVLVVGTNGRVFLSKDDGYTFWKQDIEGIDNDNILLAMFDRLVANVFGDNGDFFRLSITPSTEGYQPGIYDIEYNEWMPMKTFGEVTDRNAGSSWGISKDADYVCGIIKKLNPVTKNYNGGAGLWTPEGPMMLENMFNDDKLAYSRANAVSDNGAVVVGFQDKMGPWMACVWKRNAEGVYEQRLLFKDLDMTPADVDFTNFDDIISNCLGNALAVSPSGYWVGGTGGSWYCTDNAWIWNEDDGLIELPVTGATVAVTDDGKMAAGRGDGGFGAWLWTEEDGVRDMSEVVYDLGGKIDSFYPTGFYAMSPNKRFLVGHAIDSDMKPHAYVVDLMAEQVNVETMNASQVKASVYPNPVVSELHVDLPYDADTLTTTITLVNMQGAVCRRIDNASHTNVIDVNGLGNGVYVLDVRAGNTHKTFKVVVK